MKRIGRTWEWDVIPDFVIHIKKLLCLYIWHILLPVPDIGNLYQTLGHRGVTIHLPQDTICIIYFIHDIIILALNWYDTSNPFWDSKPEFFSDIACLRIPYQPCIVLFGKLFSGTPASNRHKLRLHLNVVPTGAGVFKSRHILLHKYVNRIMMT